MNTSPRNILAATDYSETAERAVALAGILAVRFSADLHLLHVAVLAEDSNLDEGSRDQLDRLQAISEETRRELLEKSSENHDVSVTPLLVRGIDPDEVIVETASNLGCDLIVMGTHGRRASPESWYRTISLTRRLVPFATPLPGRMPWTARSRCCTLSNRWSIQSSTQWIFFRITS